MTVAIGAASLFASGCASYAAPDMRVTLIDRGPTTQTIEIACEDNPQLAPEASVKRVPGDQMAAFNKLLHRHRFFEFATPVSDIAAALDGEKAAAAVVVSVGGVTWMMQRPPRGAEARTSEITPAIWAAYKDALALTLILMSGGREMEWTVEPFRGRGVPADEPFEVPWAGESCYCCPPSSFSIGGPWHDNYGRAPRLPGSSCAGGQ